MMSRAQEMIERIHSDVVRCCELNNPIKVVVLNPLDFWTVLKEIGEHETPPAKMHPFRSAPYEGDQTFRMSTPAGTVEVGSSPRVHVGTTYYPATHEEV